jgi:hypothetical protein
MEIFKSRELPQRATGDSSTRIVRPLTYGGHECRDFAPAGFPGHWREWHRGHGCRLDDGKGRQIHTCKVCGPECSC